MRAATAAILVSLAAASTVATPRTVRINHRVTVWVSGATAADISEGDSAVLTLQPTVNRGGNGFGAAPKFSAFVLGSRVEIEFTWPAFDHHCIGATHCVATPWHIGSRADISVCAVAPDGTVESCGRATTTLRR